jgi:hypothetical protein
MDYLKYDDEMPGARTAPGGLTRSINDDAPALGTLNMNVVEQ